MTWIKATPAGRRGAHFEDLFNPDEDLDGEGVAAMTRRPSRSEGLPAGFDGPISYDAKANPSSPFAAISLRFCR